jgi:hypothetical protein
MGDRIERLEYRSVLRVEMVLPFDPEAKGPVDWALYLWPRKNADLRWERIEGGTCDDWPTAMDEAQEAITENFAEGG